MENLQILNEEAISNFAIWVQGKRQLAFFAPLVLGTKFVFKDKEYMMGRFGSESLVLTNANDIFLCKDFLAKITLKQGFYVLLNGVLQIAHLHPHRLMPLSHPDTTLYPHIETPIIQACINTAAMLKVNNDLSQIKSLRYYETMEGCDHILGTISPDNYWMALGWEEISDVPEPIRDFTKIIDLTVEAIAHLFIKHHNPDNPPRMTQPLWGQATPGELDNGSSQAAKSRAKALVKKAVANAKQYNLNDVFCPYELQDLHMLDTVRLNYKHFLEQLIDDANTDWDTNEYDRRTIDQGEYKFTTDTERMKCVIYVDTSGSLIDNVKDVLTEALTIIRSQSSRALFKFFNTSVENPDEENWLTETSSINDITLPTTTGGTNWQPLCDDINEKHADDNVIIITDGYFWEGQGDITYPAKHTKSILMVMTKNFNSGIDYQSLGFLVGYSDIQD